MKTVRYAVGALGAIGVVPTLGLTAPVAAAATQAPATTGKTVSLLTDAPGCNARHTANYATGLSGAITYSRDNGCIGSVWGRIFIQNPPTGLWMRVRFWANGNMISQRMNKNGHIGNHSIHWSSSPRIMGVQKVCETIVPSNAPTRSLYGPVCEDTGF